MTDQIHKTKTPIKVILTFEKMRFENLSPQFNTHNFGSDAYIITCRASTHVPCQRSEQINQINSIDIHTLKHIFRNTQP